jgi:hypothetical protein
MFNASDVCSCAWLDGHQEKEMEEAHDWRWGGQSHLNFTFIVIHWKKYFDPISKLIGFQFHENFYPLGKYLLISWQMSQITNYIITSIQIEHHIIQFLPLV